jgi:ribosomal protein S10
MNYKLKVSKPNLQSLFIFEKLIKTFTPTLKIIFLPKKKKRFVLLKSPHVNKKSKEHFQFLRYQRLYYINEFNLSIFKDCLLKSPNDLNIIFKIVS